MKLAASLFVAATLAFAFAFAPGTIAQVDNADADNQIPLAPNVDPTGAERAEPATTANAALPDVRLTPPITHVTQLDAFALDLSGPWQFNHQRPTPFTGQADQVETWDTVQVPGHFALQGHEPLPREFDRAVVFRKEFDIPADWQDRSIFLQFESIDGLIKLWCNGRPVASSDSAFLPVEFNLTPFLRPGQTNDIALSIEMSDLTGWYRRPLGGIGRPVTLLALPKTHLARFHADTDLHDDGSATLHTHLTVQNDSDLPTQNATLTFQLTDPQNNPVDLGPQATLALPVIAPNTPRKLELPLEIDRFQAWNPEHPRLYQLAITLQHADDAVTAKRPIGFRETTIDGHLVRVNGQPIQLFGINYHVTHPGYGHFPPVGLIERDLKIFRDHNVNALRAWPTPYRDLIDAANTLGLYTTVEVPINLQLYAPGPRKDHGNNPELTQPYLQLAARVLETYRSDPSVLFWGLANESIYHPYFQRAAVAMHQSDPTRPIFFGGDGRMGVDIPGVQLHDEHYPRDGIATVDQPGNIQPAPHALNHRDKPANFGWTFPKNKPALSSEWLHTHVNNRAQINLDPGIDDFWGYAAQAHADWTRNTPNFVGGFQFLSAPYHAIGGKNQWRGLIDDHRRPTTNLWHLKKAYAPLALDQDAVRFNADAHTVAFTIQNRHDFTDLRELHFTATQTDDENSTQTFNLIAPPGASADAQLTYDPNAGPITLTATSIRGYEVDRFTLHPPAQATPPPQTPLRRIDHTRLPNGHHAFRIGDRLWEFDDQTGLLAAGRFQNQTILNQGPQLVLRGNSFPGEGSKQTPPMANLLDDWTLDDEGLNLDIQHDGKQATVTATGQYPRARGTFTYTLHADGSLACRYDFTWTWQTPNPIDVFEHGQAFTVAPDYDTLHWQRNAQWSAYPEHHIGRPIGVAPATGHPTFADAHANHQEGAPPTWPWSQDRHEDGTTRDFRSTKFFIQQASLQNVNGTGLRITSSPDHRQHARAHPHPDGGFTLLTQDFHHGGSEFHLIKSLRFQTKFLKAGDPLQGETTLELIGPHAPIE